MLIKSADDKTKRLALLEDLQKSSYLDAQQKKWLREELQRHKKGIQGERESAYYLDNHFKDGANHVLLHDLRLVVDGEVAQIDHLVIGRLGYFFLIETKNYAGNLEINAHGEFTVNYDGDLYGIPSPLEQSRRHERVLFKLLERLGITGRLDKQPDVHHVVMMHPKAVIRRPDPKAFDTSFLIKADQFPTWHEKFADDIGTATVLKALLNMRSQDTIKEWGEKLKRQHRPADLLELPPFMQPKPELAAAPRASKASPQAVEPTSAAAAPIEVDASLAKKLICAHCHGKISYDEGKYCWSRSKRFGGLQYCREHQALFA